MPGRDRSSPGCPRSITAPPSRACAPADRLGISGALRLPSVPSRSRLTHRARHRPRLCPERPIDRPGAADRPACSCQRGRSAPTSIASIRSSRSAREADLLQRCTSPERTSRSHLERRAAICNVPDACDTPATKTPSSQVAWGAAEHRSQAVPTRGGGAWNSQSGSIPSSDEAFRRHVERLTSRHTFASPGDLATRLRRLFPRVLVRASEVSGQNNVWYVYRDGVGSNPEASWWVDDHTPG